MTKLLETVDLVTNFYTYEGVVKALNQVSLVVDHGATFGLVGESGCGKSVTVRSIMRIVQEPGRIESGKVIVYLDEANRKNGIDLLKQSEAYMQSLRGDRISMIFQEPNSALNPTMSIGDQVSESFLFHQKKEMSNDILQSLAASDPHFLNPLNKFLQGVYRICANNPADIRLRILNKLPLIKLWQKRLKREARRRSLEIIEKLGIPNPAQVVNQYPHNLSGGMKQRIVIAIALACNPVLLIADEATSNLDVTIQAQILDLLNRLKEQAISSILLITHDLGVVAETCDRVGVMYAGNLCEVADVAELFENPLHPYTRALLDAVPRLEMHGELQSIEGNVPNLVTPPPGCRFHPRCPHAMDVCRKTFPQMKEVKKGHLVACYWIEKNNNKNGQDSRTDKSKKALPDSGRGFAA
ncbi:Oligopeptide ABC transporter, ATP-binding protein OppD (TC 3.A.1.5.1) [Olavius sp. associated proteobacterium Delta 1]|nr:Oligopeptide ABC transporter, ATP-binding protein OppD (TC 3.A.1.5.1) [Olavius sp. associated proteobacterium Delta 1]